MKQKHFEVRLEEPEQEPEDAEQGERKLLLGKREVKAQEPGPAHDSHASKSSSMETFGYVTTAFMACVVMIVLQKGIFETPTSHGLFRRFVFMSLLEAFSKFLIFLIALALEMNTVGSLKQLAVQTYQYAMSVKLAAAIWVPSLILGSLGLMLIPASLMIMLRCLNIPCTAGMRCVAFSHRPSVTQVLSIGMVTVGVICGVMLQASNREFVLTSSEFNWSGFYIGIFAGLSVSTLTALRCVMEETFVIHDKVPPLMVVGIEGLLMFCGCFAVFVACHYIGLEDWWTTRAMLNDSNVLYYLIGAYLLTNMAWTWASIMITAKIDCTTRVIVRGSSIYGVWMLQLGVFAYTAGTHGERWITPGSFFYMIAMGVTIAACVCYARFK